MAYRIDPLRPLADEIRRIALSELDSALDLLADPSRKGVEQSIHSVRKRCKRVRALVRIVRPSLGPVYREVNGTMRDAAGLLSPLRDAHAVLSTFDVLVRTRSSLVPAHGLGDVRASLAEKANLANADHSGGDRFAQAAALLAGVRKGVGEWHLDDEIRSAVDGAAIYHGLARAAFRQSLADSSDERMHEWRKRVKDNWYHTELLRQLAPSVLSAAEKVLADLADSLGDNNDLAVLAHALHASPDELGGPQAHGALAIIQQVRETLVNRSRRIGATVYAEDDTAFRHRLRRYEKAYRRFGPEKRVGDLNAIFGDD